MEITVREGGPLWVEPVLDNQTMEDIIEWYRQHYSSEITIRVPDPGFNFEVIDLSNYEI